MERAEGVLNLERRVHEADSDSGATTCHPLPLRFGEWSLCAQRVSKGSP